MSPMIQPVAESFRFTNNIMQLVLGDVSEEDAVKRTRGGEGPSISWLVGHLLHYRCQTMNLLGANKQSPYAEKFSDAGAGDGSDYPSFSDLRAQWNQLQEELETVLAPVTDEALTRPAPGSGGPHGERRVLDSLIFFMWHESYHMGALGAVRKELGYPGTADLVMAAGKK